MMPIRRIVGGLGSLFLLCVIALATASAQGLANQKTFFTFSQSVELPGHVMLQPGKYMFKLADTTGSRHVVQVLNEEGTRIFATILTVSAQRLEPSDESVVTFAEVSVAAPHPVRYWYYPGRREGHEFVYPKDQAQRIAKAANTRVLTTDSATVDTESLKQARIQTVEPSGTIAQFEDRAEPTPAQVQNAQERRDPGVANQTSTDRQVPGARGTSGQIPDQPRTARNELPRTASFGPLVGLIGLMSFAGFVALRMLKR